MISIYFKSSNTANLRTDLQYRVHNFSEPSASPYYNVSEDEVNTGDVVSVTLT
mgnify:CR=1 FL=1